MRVGIITLGCDKNTVDNEYLAGLLHEKGWEVVFPEKESYHIAREIDAVVILTCSFILDAKEESIEVILHWAEQKANRKGNLRLYVAGCLTQQYGEELLSEIPEIDGIAGTGQFFQLANIIHERKGKHRIVSPIPSTQITSLLPRIQARNNTPCAFLKIGDGCNHRCSFCIIPQLKGPLSSVPQYILLEEAKRLIADGVRELVLIAQDVTAYGLDWDGKRMLPDLLRQLAGLDGDFRIRCLYCYPGGIDEPLLDVLASEEKIVPYLDIPFQHFDPIILKNMNRPVQKEDAFDLISHIRERIPGVILRTSVITGFPGESYRSHEFLLESIEKIRFQWLGVFRFSREEGTPAAMLPGQIDEITKQERWNEIMQLQLEVTEEWNQARIGSRVRVLIEAEDKGNGCFIGRSFAEAPGVDGEIRLYSDMPLSIGKFKEAEIIAAEGYDVIARPISS